MKNFRISVWNMFPCNPAILFPLKIYPVITAILQKTSLGNKDILNTILLKFCFWKKPTSSPGDSNKAHWGQGLKIMYSSAFSRIQECFDSYEDGLHQQTLDYFTDKNLFWRITEQPERTFFNLNHEFERLVKLFTLQNTIEGLIKTVPRERINLLYYICKKTVMRFMEVFLIQK